MESHLDLFRLPNKGIIACHCKAYSDQGLSMFLYIQRIKELQGSG